MLKDWNMMLAQPVLNGTTTNNNAGASRVFEKFIPDLGGHGAVVNHIEQLVRV